MEKYVFKRSLYINDTDTAFRRPKKIRETDSWAFAIDGKFVTKVDERGQWWVDGYMVNKDWCEKASHFSVVRGSKPEGSEKP